MVFQLRALMLGLWLGLGLAAADPVLIALKAEPPDAEVYSSDGKQRYSESAARPFYFEPARLKVGQTTLSQAAFLLRKAGYKDAVASIPSEQILHAPAGSTVRWPPGESTIPLASKGGKPWWVLAFLPVLAALLWRRPAAPVSALSVDSSSAWELPAGYAIGRYRVEERLGEGVSAVVYRVVDTQEPGPPLALKLLKPAESRDGPAAGRFRREMKALARLRHANIPYLADFGEFHDLFYLVMEYLPGQNLRQRLAQGPLPSAEAVDIVRQLADALAGAHKQGVLHRDIKPDNVVWGEDGKPRLTDFGLARAHDSTTLTVEGTLLGTPSYMAPELVSGEASTPATDQYSLACLAFELVAGRPPFLGESPLAIAVQHVHAELPDLTELAPTLPEPFRAALVRALAKEPDQRFADLDEFRQACLA